jgi:hypothetical protein
MWLTWLPWATNSSILLLIDNMLVLRLSDIYQLLHAGIAIIVMQLLWATSGLPVIA